MKFYEERDSFKVVFRNNNIIDKHMQSGQVSGQVGGQVNQIEKYKQLVLEFCKSPKTATEIKTYLGMNSKNYVREKIINPLVKNNSLGYNNKKHINASNQKYITLEK